MGTRRRALNHNLWLGPAHEGPDSPSDPGSSARHCRAMARAHPGRRDQHPRPGQEQDVRAETEATAVALMTAAYAHDDACALFATRRAFAPVDDRVLVSFCLVEVCWSWAPPTTTNDHPVLWPTFRALHTGDREAVRSALVRAITGKTFGSYAALLVQLAHRHCAPRPGHRRPAEVSRPRRRCRPGAREPASGERSLSARGRRLRGVPPGGQVLIHLGGSKLLHRSHCVS